MNIIENEQNKIEEENIDLSNQKRSLNKNNINSNNISEQQLKESPIPNFTFKENIYIQSDCNYGLNESFDVFTSEINNINYLITVNKTNNNIEIIDIDSKTLIKVIEGNSSKFIYIKYFQNISNKKQYLITIDLKGIIQILEISEKNNFEEINLISKIITKREFQNNWNFINSTLLFQFQIGSKFYDIIIVAIRASKIYAKLDQEKYKSYSSGFVYEKNEIDFLFAANSCGEVNIYNLFSKELSYQIKINKRIENIRLYGLILWSENYLIVNDDTNKALIVIDLRNKYVISSIYNQHFDSVRCIKRIKHKKYGECLITGGDDHFIKLFSCEQDIILPIFKI